MTIQITLVGLGQIGASVGLALKTHTDLVRRIGHDRQPENAQQAEKLGALDQVAYNLPSAVRQADILFLAEPIHQARETLELVATDLKAGAVVMDISPVKVHQAAFATQLLPPDRHFVALTPTLNPDYLDEAAEGIEAAHADLFQNSQVFITAPAGAHTEAVQLAADLVNLLGATPIFSDPYELDGLLAATHILPLLSAAALLNATTQQAGWQEARKVAGKSFAQATRPALTPGHAEAISLAALQNSENVTRVLDNLIQELENLRTAVSTADSDRMQQLLEQAILSRETWQQQRSHAQWERADTLKDAAQKSGQIFGHLFRLNKKSRNEKGRK